MRSREMIRLAACGGRILNLAPGGIVLLGCVIGLQRKYPPPLMMRFSRLEELHCRFTDIFCNIRTHHSDNSAPGMASAASFTCAAAWHMAPRKNPLGLLKQRVRKKVFPTMP